jgi:hypothetical protein
VAPIAEDSGQEGPEHAQLRVGLSDRQGVLSEVTGTLGALQVIIYDLEIVHDGDLAVLVLQIDSRDREACVQALGAKGFRPQ